MGIKRRLAGVPYKVGTILDAGGMRALRLSMMSKTATQISGSEELETTSRTRVRKWSGLVKPPRSCCCIENSLAATLPFPTGKGDLRRLVSRQKPIGDWRRLPCAVQKSPGRQLLALEAKRYLAPLRLAPPSCPRPAPVLPPP